MKLIFLFHSCLDMYCTVFTPVHVVLIKKMGDSQFPAGMEMV